MTPTTLRIGTESELVQAILKWPPHLVQTIRRAILKRHAKTSLLSAEQALLADQALIDPASGAWTELGAAVEDLLVHESWLEGDEVRDVLSEYPDQVSGDVLDVGCSTGLTLRQLRQPQPTRRVGVDVDETALALGHRLAESEEQTIEFESASAHELPFPAGSFDCVICRNAITYTHHRSTLGEITRVLKPGGIVFLRFENYRYDLDEILSRPGLKRRLCRTRDYAFGVLNTWTGWQPMPGMPLGPGRVFGSPRRIRQLLKRGGCAVTQIAESLNCPRRFGGANQTWILATKAGAIARNAPGAALSTPAEA